MRLPSLPTPQALPVAAKVIAVHVFDVALQKSPRLRSHVGPVRSVGSQVAPAVLTAVVQVPLPPLASMPTHDSPVAHGASRVQAAPAAASVTQVVVLAAPGEVKQVCPRSQVPPLLQSAPEASAVPQLPQAAFVRPVQ